MRSKSKKKKKIIRTTISKRKESNVKKENGNECEQIHHYFQWHLPCSDLFIPIFFRHFFVIVWFFDLFDSYPVFFSFYVCCFGFALTRMYRQHFAIFICTLMFSLLISLYDMYTRHNGKAERKRNAISKWIKRKYTMFNFLSRFFGIFIPSLNFVFFCITVHVLKIYVTQFCCLFFNQNLHYHNVIHTHGRITYLVCIIIKFQ